MKAKGFTSGTNATKPKGQEVWKGAHIHVAVPRTQGVPTVQVGIVGRNSPVSQRTSSLPPGEALKKKRLRPRRSVSIAEARLR